MSDDPLARLPGAIHKNLAEGAWITPLEQLLRWQNDFSMPNEFRLKCALKAVEFMHAKPAARMDITADVPDYSGIPTQELEAGLKMIKSLKSNGS